METSRQERRPGDAILDRYMPNASAIEREEAYENLKRLALVLMRIEDRLSLDWHEEQIRNSHGSAVEFERAMSPPK